MNRLPAEILTIIFEELVIHQLLRPYTLGEKRVQEAHDLRLVSKTVQAIVEPMLYKRIWQPSHRRSRVLCQLMIKRPHIAAMVKEIALHEGNPNWEGEAGLNADQSPSTGWKWASGARGRRRSGSLRSPREIPTAQEHSLQLGETEADMLDSETLDAAAELMKGVFKTRGERIRETLEPESLERIKASNAHVMKCVLLLQLTNLTSLSISASSPEFVNLTLLLRLPRLEDLTFVKLPPRNDVWDMFAPPEEILESIISSTDRLKSLHWEYISGSGSDKNSIKAPKLKKILERHASTLEYVEVNFTRWSYVFGSLETKTDTVFDLRDVRGLNDLLSPSRSPGFAF